MDENERVRRAEDLLRRIRERNSQGVTVLGPRGVTTTTYGEVMDIWHIICDAYWYLSEKVPADDEVTSLIKALDHAGLKVLDLLGE